MRSEYQSPYFSHAKQALYHLSDIPTIFDPQLNCQILIRELGARDLSHTKQESNYQTDKQRHVNKGHNLFYDRAMRNQNAFTERSIGCVDDSDSLGERYTEDLMVLGSIPGFGNQSLSASHVV
ncbi:hypothetical protein OUZ56_033240 [Daphnia magna]|uniref:Uncharacterized protein n=1 Tax=Daphnia magna TaxID=35525 RepID=A0ABQ9ZXS0_9CRUS|nr:hypothetical protein OUZ56_033240 [Daphnia magna]